MKLESLKEFQANSLNQAEMNNVFGGKKITTKLYGTMRQADGRLYYGIILAQFDTDTQTYRYFDILGKEVYCP